MQKEIPYFRQRDDVAIVRNRLPHWSQDDATYFVTFRLGDSLPASLLNPWRLERDLWLKAHPPPWMDDEERAYFDRFTVRIEHWLDAGHGSCLFRREELRTEVAGMFARDDGRRILLHAHVIMPNHVHVLFSITTGQCLPRVMRSWKGVSAHRINTCRGARGSVWQKDYFDRLIRDEDHFRRCVRYIRSNPARAKLKPDEFTLYESAFVRTIN